MERRKVQRVGGGTYTVSLPKAWAERVGLSAGTAVHLDPCAEGLVVEPATGADDPTARVVVAVDGTDPRRLERLLRAAYAAGFETLELVAPSGFSREGRRTVERTANGFVGVALDAEADDRLVLRALLDPDEVSVRQSVRQLSYTALSMHRDATAALDGDGAPGVAERDDETGRLFAMVDRHVGRGLARLDEADALGLSRAELFDLRAVARELERVADAAASLAGVAAADPEGPVAPVTALARDAAAVAETATAVAVGDADPETAHDALDARGAVRERAHGLDADLADAGAYRLGRALDPVLRTVEAGGTVAELGLRAAVRRGDLDAAETELAPGDD
ncbi:phosphate signaling complex PhoU family protein [Halosegnis marinus]|uniref:PhoU domain-containing protein n=1 Tax=Halosegnis marinus TaxID=3034023 RepID=A0ABD5ZNJ5_9EURY|nr:phosphate uptake regulator PhoU [Halosegnis sp. DT85]